MEVDFLTSLISVGLMTALAVPGFIVRKLKMLPEQAVAALVVILMYVSQPVMVVDGFLGKDFDPALLLNMLITFVLALIFHAIIFLVGKLIFSWWIKKDASEDEQARIDKENRMCTITCFMGNCGFMGIPVMKALFPQYPEMLLYTTVIIVAFNIAGWTMGVFTVTGNKKDMGLKRALLNPPTAALVVGLPLFFLKSFIPTEILSPIESVSGYLADMTLPLSMIILGIRLAETRFVDLFSSVKVYAASAVKLVICPLICFGILLLIRLVFPALDQSVIVTLYIVMAMPSASMCLSFAEMFDGDRYTAVKVTLLSTLLSVVTIPLLMLLCVVL